MTAAVPRLVWEKADGSRIEFPLTSEVTVVGRDGEADVQVDEPLVSRNHARIERRGTAYFVVDLGSTNYTKVNGKVVAERELKDGDKLQFARARCVFLLEPVRDPVAGGV